MGHKIIPIIDKAFINVLFFFKNMLINSFDQINNPIMIYDGLLSCFTRVNYLIDSLLKEFMFFIGGRALVSEKSGLGCTLFVL